MGNPKPFKNVKKNENYHSQPLKQSLLDSIKCVYSTITYDN